jgi:hypothetical protein
LLVEGSLREAPRAALRLWQAFQELNDLNVAYNFEVALREGGQHFRCFLFRRHPGPEVAIPGGGKLDPNFGGWELSGDIVIQTREVFDWICRNPGPAVRLTEERLRDTTRPPPR